MFSKSLIAAFAAAPAIVSAGNAIVKNNCAKTVNGWSVAINRAEKIVIPPGGTYSEPYFQPTFGGVSMKLSYDEQSSPYTSLGMTQFEYTLGSMVWYDISNINGDMKSDDNGLTYPFEADGITLVPGESSCPTKTCPAGQSLCGDAYNVPDDNHATGACSSSTDTTLILCSDNEKSDNAPEAVAAPAAPVAAPAAAAKVDPPVQQEKAPAPPSPAPAAPATTAAPVASPVVVAAPDAGVWTTFVTQIVTVQARDAAPEPTAVPMKRDEDHANMHKRSAHRHHFHRHGADSN